MLTRGSEVRRYTVPNLAGFEIKHGSFESGIGSQLPADET